MKIDGPLSISIKDDDIQKKRTLEINFKPDFQQLLPDQQTGELKKYIQNLYRNAHTLNEDHPDKAGLLLIMQVSEQLLPYLQQQQLDLSETMLLEMSLGGPQTEISVSLSDIDIH